MISLIGEMVDSQNMTKTTQEITKADTLLLLGTTPGFRGVLPVHTVFCRAEHGNHT